MNMKTTWVKQLTEDKLELSALLFEPEKKTDTIVIHFHGKEGNFLTNRFIFEMKDQLPANGIAFMTANQRDRDYLSETLLQTPAGFEFKQIGFAHSFFEDCVKDIKTFVDEVGRRGYKKIFLEGHSLPHKTIYYHITTKDKRLSGIISMCMSDLLFQFRSYVEDYETNLKLAKAMVSSGMGEEMMPVLLWAQAPASAKTFLSYGNPQGNAQMFSFCDENFNYKALKKITLPILYVEPETDFSMGINPKKALEICIKETPNSKQAGSLYIEKASHSFINAEDRLIRGIVNWVKKTS